MSIGPRLELRQAQSLVMTPQLRQAIKLLQFSNMEVAAFVEEELERNPLLERDERADALPERAALDQRDPLPEPRDAAEAVGGDLLTTTGASPLDADPHDQYENGPGDGVAYDNADPGRLSDRSPGANGGLSGGPEDDGTALLAEQPRSLREHLAEQLRLNIADPAERLIGAHLIALLDAAGRVPTSDEDIASALGIAPEAVAAMRARMGRFDPPGLFAQDLRGCLEAQLRELDRFDPAMAALLDNLELLARRDLKRLQAVCEVDAEDLAEMIAEIRALDPKPGAGFDDAPMQAVVPDVLMFATPKGEWVLELNPDTMPRLLVSGGFYARAVVGAGRDTRQYLAEQLASANWLVKSLHQRAQTILKVASELMRQQDGFLRHGVGHLRPLILRDIADAVEMHESTVSRVTTNKYIATPRGLFELKYFFTTAIAATAGGESHSAEAVRHRIRAMVAAETPQEILSDDAIVAALRREGVDIARRTVAKYREALRIPSSVQRKREKSMPA
ncbi:RNA polymerase factor sigma-54 [Rhizosaccharibacter radicis]|uniref:RNA polymerase sigma-54 factor n=1 Tax=Rhizosaccharibacter radicis TaxID=2782605 RepID=A0ABT1VX79_9PROT|nr:RNA polymerase factor sigma-54 [Acetobacteraceae bacterium KSS12]